MKYKSFVLINLMALLGAFACIEVHAQQQANWNSSSNEWVTDQKVSHTTASSDSSSSFNFGVVNTKKSFENSKLGKQEQANFEKMKNQMESVLHEKEKALEEIEKKLANDDWLDSVPESTINELRSKRKAIRSEGVELQNQYMQTLQQTQVKIVQKLNDLLNKASALVAKEGIKGEKLYAIFTDEACTYFDSMLECTDSVVEKMDALYDEENKNNTK